MNSHDIFPLVYSHNTNSNSAITDINAIKGKMVLQNFLMKDFILMEETK